MTDYVLLDTDVYSYLWKGDPRGEPFRSAIEGLTPAVSFATVAELYKGAAKKGWGATSVEKLETHLQGFLVVPFDIELARVCGRLLAERERAGRAMEEFDAWIAATAIRHDIPVATHNRKHFEDIPELRLVAVADPPPRI